MTRDLAGKVFRKSMRVSKISFIVLNLPEFKKI